MQQAVQHILKFIEQLHFVKQNIVLLIIVYSFVNVCKHIVRIAQGFIHAVIQRNFYYVRVVHAAFTKVVMKKPEQQI